MLIKRTLAAAKKSSDPQAIATAYGIFVDWTSKIDLLEYKESIRKAADKLLKEIERASQKSDSPMKIAMAFGILMDKNARGFEQQEDMAQDLITPKSREDAYAKLDTG